MLFLAHSLLLRLLFFSIIIVRWAARTLKFRLIYNIYSYNSTGSVLDQTDLIRISRNFLFVSYIFMRVVCPDNRLFYSYYTIDRSGLQGHVTAQKHGNVRSDNLGSFEVFPSHYKKIFKIKLSRCTNFSNLFFEWNSTCFGQFFCPSSGVFHCTHNNTCRIRTDPASKLSANLYDIYHCCVYSRKLLVMDRGSARNM